MDSSNPGRSRRSVTRRWRTDGTAKDVGVLDMESERFCCHACGGERFRRRTVLLNTRGFTFFGLDWLNPRATCYECLKCSYLHWFADSNDSGRG